MGVSPVATGDQGSAFGNRELLKKFDQNFLALCCRVVQRKWHCILGSLKKQKTAYEEGKISFTAVWLQIIFNNLAGDIFLLIALYHIGFYLSMPSGKFWKVAQNARVKLYLSHNYRASG